MPGLLLSVAVALAATALSRQLGGPQLLYALLMGLSLHVLTRHGRWQAGLTFASRTVLRAGVALLGLRITFDQITALGWRTGLAVVMAVASTMTVGCWLAKRLNRPFNEGLVSGASVGICGASAALAVASVLPPTRENERFTLLAVVGVTLLSTVAMMVYPLGLQWAGVMPVATGVFLGATIHDVAQVVAAGMMMSPPGDPTITDTATVVKLFRVMLLMPIALLVSWLVRSPATHPADEASQAQGVLAPQALEVPLVPRFLLIFIVFMLLVTSGLVPPSVTALGSDVSRACLVTAIAAAGLKTRLQDLWRLGWVPVVMLVTETLWIALFVSFSLIWFI